VETTLHGTGVSPGIVIGPALIFDVDRFDVPQYVVKDCPAELARLNRAIEVTRQNLTQLYDKTASELGHTHASIFEVHLMLLDDVALRDEVALRLESEGVNVERILDDLARRYAQIIRQSDDPHFRERTADLLDVVDRLLRQLLDAERPNLAHLPHPSILVAHEFSPSDAANIDLVNTLGVVMDSGSPTSHTGILLRALEIPTVMGLNSISTLAQPGSSLIIDGTEGLAIAEPSTKTIIRYEKTREIQLKEWAIMRDSIDAEPCVTLDGIQIPTYTNIGLPMEIEHSQTLQADGVGLYRTEFLFLNRRTPPTEEEQYEAYTTVVRSMAPRPVTLRTIDVGGDKFNADLMNVQEANPQLGWRAVRFCLAEPEIFSAQLRAMLRASAHGNVEIMFPMISGVHELHQIQAVVKAVRDDLTAQKISFDPDLRVGIMVEVPSAVEMAEELSKECDFFRIGTNDLIQYSLAVDRVNEKVAYLFEPAHPAILRMIKRTCDAAWNRGIPCGLCGEMAGSPLFTEVLLGLGVNSLSMSAVSLPIIRKAISQINIEQARCVAEKALQLPTVTEVKGLLRERFEELKH
jgi:phosphotransferase system enzyme I (PtsI)